MNFITPALLTLAAGALVPLLIHLLRRRTGKKMDFPAARYLLRAEKENSRRLRIRNLLLMMLRVATVLLIALAAARPIGGVAGVGHAPSAIAIVIDNSLSSSVIVDGRPLLHQLRDAAIGIATAATSADRIWLVNANGEATSGSIAVVRQAIQGIEPTAGSGDMTMAVARATALVDASGLDERRIALLTDGQRFEWRDVERLDAGEAGVHVLSPVVVLPPNRSVSGVEPRPARWTPLGELAARIASADSTSYRIDLAGRAFARGTAAPGEEVTVSASPQERGWLAGFVEIQPDEMRADDVRHFAVWIGAPPSAQTTPSAGTFVNNAISALVDAGRVARGSNILVASAEEATALPTLIFPPLDPVKVGAANRAMERLGIPWQFGEAVRGPAAVRPSAGSVWNDNGVNVNLRYTLVMRAAGDADTLAVVNGQPWMVGGKGYVIFASPAHPDASNFPLRASFIPLLAELLTQRLSGEGGSVISAFPGASVQRPIWADAMKESESSSRILDGSSFTAPRESGVYFLSRAGNTSGALVVNPPAGEFELDRISGSELRARFTSENVKVTADAERWTREVFESSGRRPLVLPFLLLALGALAVESLVSREGRGAERREAKKREA